MISKKKFTAESLLKLHHVSELTSDGYGTFAYRNTVWDPQLGSYRSEIVLVRPDGEAYRFSSKSLSYENPKLSPDRRSLAVMSCAGGHGDLLIFNVLTGDLTQRISFPHIEDIAWAPDGHTLGVIAYEEQPLDEEVILIEETGRKTNSDGGLIGRRRYLLYNVQAVSGERQAIYQDDHRLYGIIAMRTEEAWILYSGSVKGYVKVSRAGHNTDVLSSNTALMNLWTRAALLDNERILVSPVPDISNGSGQNSSVAIIATDGSGYEIKELDESELSALAPPFADGDVLNTKNAYLSGSVKGGSAFAIGIHNGLAGVYELRYHSGRLSWRSICDGGVYTCIAALTESSLITVWSYEDKPPEVVLIDVETGRKTTLTHENLWLEEYRLYSSDEIKYHADGEDFTGWVVMPGEQDEPVPAMLTIHGGPGMFYGRGFSPERQILAANGYAVIYGNPRGSTGYGYEYASAEYAYNGSAGRELVALVDAAVQQKDIDTDKVSVMGGSYGGYLTAWLASKTDRFHSACALRGIFSYYFTSFLSESAGQPIPGDLDEVLNSLLEISAFYHAETVNIPMLICHREKDMICPVECAYQLYAAVADNAPGVPLKLKIFPGCGHSIDPKNAENSIAYYSEILSWLEEYKDWSK